MSPGTNSAPGVNRRQIRPSAAGKSVSNTTVRSLRGRRTSRRAFWISNRSLIGLRLLTVEQEAQDGLQVVARRLKARDLITARENDPGELRVKPIRLPRLYFDAGGVFRV